MKWMFSTSANFPIIPSFLSQFLVPQTVILPSLLLQANAKLHKSHTDSFYQVHQGLVQGRKLLHKRALGHINASIHNSWIGNSYY